VLLIPDPMWQSRT